MSNEIATINEDFRIKLQKFIQLLSKQPNANDISKTPDGKANTLPIDFVETTLDEMFFGMWQTHSFTFSREFNEMVGCITLEVLNPVTGLWIKRVGAGSIIIQQDKEAQLSEFNSTKKKNALDLGFPKLKAECLKNAAQSLGNVLGRNLNRKLKDTYTPLIKPAKKELLENTPEWNEAVKQKFTLKQLESKFTISEENQKLLLKQQNNL